MRTSSRSFAVLLFDEVDLLGISGVMEVVSEAGRHWNWRPFRLVPLAERPGPIATRSQIRVEAPHGLEELPQPELLLVPGGYGARRAISNPIVMNYCRTACASAEWVLAIGAGAAVVAATQALPPARIAVSAANRQWMQDQAFDQWELSEEDTLRDGKLLTAATGAYGVELGLSLVEEVLSKGLAQRVRDALGVSERKRFDLSPPLDAQVPKT